MPHDHGRAGGIDAEQAIERLTVDRASAEIVKNVAVEQGMRSLRDDGLEKARTGVTSIEEIARVVK